MTIELLQTLSTASYIIAGILLLTAIALFFVLGVPKVVGDLSGRNAKKAIEGIRRRNKEGSGNNPISMPAPVSVPTQQKKMSVGSSLGNEQTTLLDTGSSETTVLDESNKTAVLDGSGETTVLTETVPTTVLLNTEARFCFYASNEIVE